MSKIGDPRTPEELEAGVPRPPPVEGILPMPLEELFGQMRLKGFKASGQPVKLLAENDGTLRMAGVVIHSGVVGKVLGAITPASGTATILYTVPASTTVEITTLSVANRGTTKAAIRLAFLAAGGSSPADREYLYYDLPLEANSTLMLDAAQGAWLEAAATVVGRSDTGLVSFVATGKEHS